MPPKKPAFIPVPDQLGHTDHDNYYLCKRAAITTKKTLLIDEVQMIHEPLFVRVIDDLCNLFLK